MSEPTLRAAILPVTGFQQNCTLLWCSETNEGVVFDPGGDVPMIEQAIKETGIDVKQIVLTHGHIDHAGGADELREKLGVKVVGPHEDDRFLLDTLEQTGRGYGLFGARNLVPDQWLNEGDELKVGKQVFEIRHCPGHSPGSLVYINHAHRFAMVGDVLFAGSVGRTDLPGGNHEALLNSIRTKLLPLADDYSFVCGHGPASTIGHERATNPFLR